MGDFVMWKYQGVKNAATLELHDTDDALSIALMKGVSLASASGLPIKMKMTADRPKDTVLPDNVYNTDYLTVVSRRLADFLVACGEKSIELLPLVILDHKRKPVTDEYLVVNAIDPLDCVDRDNSRFRQSRSGRYERFDRFVILHDAVPSDRLLFRVAGYWDHLVMRSALAEKLDAASFSGFGFAELPDDEED